MLSLPTLSISKTSFSTRMLISIFFLLALWNFGGMILLTDAATTKRIAENIKNVTTSNANSSTIIVLCIVMVVAWTIISLFMAFYGGQVLNKQVRKKGSGETRIDGQLSYQPYCKGHVPYISYYLPQGSSWIYLGHIYNFLTKRPWDLLMEWHILYGPIVTFILLGENMISIAYSPSLLKAILQSQIQYVKKDVTNTMKPFLSILGTGIVTSEGQAWMKQRLKMSHPLRFDVLKRIPHQTLLALQRLMIKMDNSIDRKKSIPLGSSLRHLTLQVISGTFLSLTAEESDNNFAKLYLPIVDESNLRVWHPYRSYLPILPSWWLYHKNVYLLNTYVSNLIQNRWYKRWSNRQQQQQQQTNDATDTKQHEDEDDILDQILLDVETKEPVIATKSVLPTVIVHQIRDEMKTFMLAGHETSAAMMTWAIYELLLLQYKKKDSSTDDNNRKVIVQELLDEANAVFDPTIDWKVASSNDIPNIEILSQLVLSEACLKESLRKYSVVPIVTRRTIHEMHVVDETTNQSYYIPPKTTILLNIQACHWNPKYWPNPSVYNPKRFLPTTTTTNSSNTESSSEEQSQTKDPSATTTTVQPVIEPFTFLPFIAGPRNCLGQHLALLESKMVIAMLWQRYEFHFTNPSQWLTCLETRHRFMVPVIPYEEIMITVTKRRTATVTNTTNNNNKVKSS